LVNIVVLKAGLLLPAFLFLFKQKKAIRNRTAFVGVAGLPDAEFITPSSKKL
jgi:hypothetical protein